MRPTIETVKLILQMPPAALRFAAPDTAPDPRADDGPSLVHLVGRRDGAALSLLGAPTPRFATWDIAVQQTTAARISENLAIGGMALGALFPDWPARAAWYAVQIARLKDSPMGFTADTDDHKLRMVFDPAHAVLRLHMIVG